MIAAEHLHRQPPSSRSLDRLYPMPKDGRSIDDWYRNRNLDLERLDDADLDHEAFRVAARLAYETDRRHRAWLLERREAVRQERARRRGAAVRGQGVR